MTLGTEGFSRAEVLFENLKRSWKWVAAAESERGGLCMYQNRQHCLKALFILHTFSKLWAGGFSAVKGGGLDFLGI